MKILVTGTAGFIGYHLAQALLQRGDSVVGVDNVNDYYDVRLKEARLALLKTQLGFSELRISLEDRAAMREAFRIHQPQRVVNLAGQAGVRYSLQNPGAYLDSNLMGFGNILEECRTHQVEHLVYASSSSVYGANTSMPFSIHDNVDHPLSLYAATKKANELMAHTYSHLYGTPTTGLRFFTVYGPWGRPDMAPFKFVDAIIKGQTIEIYNHGQQMRDFTYVDDIVESALRVLDRPPVPQTFAKGQEPGCAESWAPYRVLNIGNSDPVQLMDFVHTIEQAVGVEATKIMKPAQPGDVTATFADTTQLEACIGFTPATSLSTGIAKFVAWYRGYYKA
jgi:UDP-glucuronate 4-epimerase